LARPASDALADDELERALLDRMAALGLVSALDGETQH
jgi:hypothetical protein